jgi:hypothetical protein
MAILARAIRVTDRNGPGLIRLHARLLDVEREAAAEVALSGPIRATVEPFPAIFSGMKESPMTPPIAVLADGAAIVPAPNRDGPSERAGAIARYAGAEPTRYGPEVRRTA